MDKTSLQTLQTRCFPDETLEEIEQKTEIRTSHGSTEDIKLLQALPNLHTLDVSGHPGKANFFRAVGTLTQLRELNAMMCPNLADSGIAELEPLKNLESLDLTLAGNGHKIAWLTAVGKLTRLKTLKLVGLAHFGDYGLMQLSELTELETLNLAGTLIEGEGLFFLDRCKNLKFLNLCDCHLTTLQFVRNFPKLEILSVGSNRQIEDIQVEVLKKVPLPLKELDLTKTHVSREMIQELKNALPDCEIYN